MEMERQKAEDIVKTEIEKEQTVIRAEAEAEKLRREAKGEADAIYLKLEAEAKGNFAILKAKGEGFNQIVSACGNDPDAAAKMLIIEKLEQVVQLQAEAIKNIKIDKVTVWDGGNSKDGKTATSNFLSGMIKSLPRCMMLQTWPVSTFRSISARSEKKRNRKKRKPSRKNNTCFFGKA